MEDLAELLEQQLERAFEVKDKKSLRQYVRLLTQNIIPKESYEIRLLELKEEIRLLAETMKEGFKSIDKRFEAVDKRFEAVDKRFEDMYRYMDKRFEDMNRRFNMLFTFMNFGFGIIILMTILFKFFVK